MENALRCSGGLCRVSPCGTLVCSVEDKRVYVRRTADLQVTKVLSCAVAADRLEWSPDSRRVLCGSTKKGVVEVFDAAEDSAWRCRVSEGVAGIAAVSFGADGGTLLTRTEFAMHLSVWDLDDNAVTVIEHPKAVRQGHCFSADGAFLAVLRRRQCRDSVSVYAAGTWEEVASFDAPSKDAHSMHWSSDGATIVLVEDAVEYGVWLLSPVGAAQAQYAAYGGALGVSHAALSPDGASDLLALGSYDNAVRVLSLVTRAVCAEYRHAHPKSLGRSALSPAFSMHAEAEDGAFRSELPAQLPARRPDQSKPLSHAGMASVQWSSCGRFLATRSHELPRCLFLWDAEDARLRALLVMGGAVRAAAWSPARPELLVHCAGKLYTWREKEGVRALEAPAPQGAPAASWLPDGDGLLLVGSREWSVLRLD